MARLFNKRGVVCASLLLAACGEDNNNDTIGQGEMSASDLEVAMSALENPIIECQIEAGACVQKASELSALQACQAGIGDCLRAAGERVQKVAEGVAACRDEQRKCLLGGGVRGGSCFDGFQACVGALVPGGDGGAPGVPASPGSGDAGVPPPPDLADGGSADGGLGDGGSTSPVPPRPTFPAAPGVDAGAPSFPPPFSGLGEAGTPGVPSFPGLGADGGRPGLPGFPGLPQPPGNDCLEGLRACFDKPGVDLFDCAAEARECLLGAAGSRFPLPFP